MSDPGATFSIEMPAVAWTAIGLLGATLFASLFYLGGRIDALSNRVDALGAKLDGRIDGFASRIDGLSSRIDGLSSRIDTHVEQRSG